MGESIEPMPTTEKGIKQTIASYVCERLDSDDVAIVGGMEETKES